MKYFCTTDLIWLTAVNARGHQPGNVTQAWVDIIKHPSRDEWAACIPDDYLPRISEILSESELAEVTSGLKTVEQMNAEGWNL